MAVEKPEYFATKIIFDTNTSLTIKLTTLICSLIVINQSVSFSFYTPAAASM